MTKQPIRISMLVAPLEQVILPSGTTVEVRPIDGIGYDLYRAMNESPNENAHLMWEIVAGCLPGVSLDEVKRLTPAECAAILAIAMGRVEQVQRMAEEMLGNVDAAMMAPLPEESRSETPSDTSAPPSPEAPAAGS